ncbi:MAG: hypothetical protein GY869_10490, partial [Planctomycetes bacterium]|nr:hypothetical protein [Planctomycetota bacterium]
VSDLSGLSNGFHVLFVRAKDDNGNWSLTYTRPFYKETISQQELPPDVTAIRYYYSLDGITQTPVYTYDSFTPQPDVDLEFIADLFGLVPYQIYNIHVTGVDENGAPSLELIHEFSIFSGGDVDTLAQENGGLIREMTAPDEEHTYLFLIDPVKLTEIQLKRNTYDFYPHLKLYDPENNLIADTYGTQIDIDDAAFGQPGIYRLKISNHDSGELGAYRLTWQGFSLGIISITAMLSPDGVIPVNQAATPQIEVTNIGWTAETFQATYQIGDVYSGVSGVMTLQRGHSAVVSFPDWLPAQAAAYLTTCATQPQSEHFTGSEAEGQVAVSSGSGPEIYDRSPAQGPNTGNFVLTLTGNDLASVNNVFLQQDGQTITASNIDIVNSQSVMATFDLLNADLGYWDLIVSDGSQSYTFYDGFEIIEFEGQLIPFAEWTEFTCDGNGHLYAGVIVPPNAANLFVLLKKTTHIGYSGTWYGMITLWRDGQPLCTENSGDDFDFQLPTPAAELYTIEIESNHAQAAGLIRFSSVLDTLDLADWHIGEVMRPYGNDWLHLDVPEGQASLFFQTEGFGLWSGLDVYYGFLDNPTQNWYFNNWGGGYHIEGQIENPPAGRYYLKYMDSAVMWDGGQYAESQMRQYMIIADTEPIIEPPPTSPVITGLSTYVGGTAGPVTVIIEGAGLDSAATVSLVRDGFADVVA